MIIRGKYFWSSSSEILLETVQKNLGQNSFLGDELFTKSKFLIMSHLDFRSNSAVQEYSLECINDSVATWTFYVYQKMPNQPSDVFSLAWFASPFRIAPGNSITFSWSIDYSFVWGSTGELQPGVRFNASGVVPAELTGKNLTTFTVIDGAPQFEPPTTGGERGSLTINEDVSVPNQGFSTGIGMSGQGTFVQQALQNTTQIYTPIPKYFVAAGTQIQMGQVLTSTVTMDAEVEFPPNVFKLTATLGDDNLWSISE